VDEFIIRANIARFRGMLAAAQDSGDRTSLERLLSDYEELLRALEAEKATRPRERRLRLVREGSP
jgi:hypothetical protein